MTIPYSHRAHQMKVKILNPRAPPPGMEILDGGLDTVTLADIREETELTKFSRTFCEMQKKALAEEKAKGNKRKTYTGRSRTTAFRQKRFQSKPCCTGIPTCLFMSS